ncbi:MAG: DMT family transporter [Candidatus Bathyarchaeota archaeon]|nr:DMT family transporter [Candidatus Bathyarchaeota archaeon]
MYKSALARTSPIPANTVRCLGTSIIMLLCLTIAGQIWTLTSLSLYVVLLASASGLIGLGLGDTLYLQSLRILGVSRAVPLTCTYPLFSLIWALMLAGEEITLQIILAAIAIVAGIWLLSWENNSKIAETDGKMLAKGVTFALLTAAIWSISISMVNLALREKPDLEHAFAINTLRVAALAVVLLAFTFMANRKAGFYGIDRKTAATLVSGGIIAIGLGWFLLTLSFTYIPESQAVPISSTTPLFSTFFSIIFLREKITLKVVFGSILVVAGTVMIFVI